MSICSAIVTSQKNGFQNKSLDRFFVLLEMFHKKATREKYREH